MEFDLSVKLFGLFSIFDSKKYDPEPTATRARWFSIRKNSTLAARAQQGIDALAVIRTNVALMSVCFIMVGA